MEAISIGKNKFVVVQKKSTPFKKPKNKFALLRTTCYIIVYGRQGCHY